MSKLRLDRDVLKKRLAQDTTQELKECLSQKECKYYINQFLKSIA